MDAILRFLLRPADQGRVLPDSLQVEETPLAPAPAWDGIYPQTLILRFQIRDPLQGPPEVVPLFPGMLRFIPDLGGTLPTPEEVSQANFQNQNWTTRGLLSNSAAEKEFQATVEAAGAGLEVVPNIVWFGPVRLTSDFLFSNLGRDAQATANPNSALRKRISGFLRGEFALRLALGADRTQDDVVKQRMPVMDMAPDGSIELRVTLARQQITLDGPKELLDTIYGPVDLLRLRRLPSHPVNGVIPARHFYRTLGVRGDLIDFAGPLAAVVAIEWPHYLPFRFRRIFGEDQESSVCFPWHFARITELPAGAITELRLPTHGVVFLPQTEAQAQTTQYTAELVQSSGGPEHELRILLETLDAWRHKAGTVPVNIDLTVAPPVIQARRRMKVEMLEEPAPAPRGDRCTYLTLRRSIRALINNRILGGRLNSVVVQPKDPLRAHLAGVLVGADYPASLFPVKYFDETENLYDEPHWRELLRVHINRLFSRSKDEGIHPDSPSGRARRLEPFLIAFFPEPAQQEVFAGAPPPADAEIWPLGKVVYHLWQTLIAEFRNDRTARNFLNVHVGLGGAGALVAARLASGYVFQPDHNLLRPASTPAEKVAHMNELVQNLLQHAEPGAICQFYSRHEDFFGIVSERQPAAGFGQRQDAYGHSPMFVEAVPPNRDLPLGGATLIDQFARDTCPLLDVQPFPGHHATLIRWSNDRAERVWVAANWDE